MPQSLQKNLNIFSKKMEFWEFYWDLTKNPNGGETLKKIKSLMH